MNEFSIYTIYTISTFTFTLRAERQQSMVIKDGQQVPATVHAVSAVGSCN